MPLRKERIYTIDDVYTLPDGQRAEIIDGQIYYMAPPSTTHQRILHFFDRIIGNHIASNQGDCEIFPAPFAVYLDEETNTYVEPDISVICDKNKLDDRGCNGAPDWIIEIVSPSSISMDYNKKLFKYRTAKVREYWIVDYAKDMVTVYNFESDHMERYTFSDSIKIGIYDDFSIDFSKLNL